MKLIIIGTSLAGKSTLIRALRKDINLPLSEIDEELTKLNNGIFPTDPKYKHEILAPKVIKKVLNSNRIIFFSNTDYFSILDLNKAHEKGFQVIQLEISLDELKKRNIKRMEEEGYDDVGEWLLDMLQYQKEIKDAGLVDLTIDATLPTEKISSDLLKYYNN